MAEPEVEVVLAKPGKTICLFSPKGGTGKTTISMVVARHLASQGRKVVVLDFDLVTAGATLYLCGNNRDSLTPENCLFDILRLGPDHDQNSSKLGSVVPVAIPLPGRRQPGTIHLIASVRSAITSRADSVEPGRFSEAFGISPIELEERVKSLLTVLKPKFDYIVIDTRGGLDELSIVPPLLSDLGLLVSDQSRLASYQLLHSRTRIESLARALGRQVSMNETPAYRGVILNKSAGEPAVVREQFADSIVIAAGQPLLGVVPFVDEVLRAGEKGELPPANLEFDYWLARCLREGLARAHMPVSDFHSMGRGLWAREIFLRGTVEVFFYVTVAVLAAVAVSAFYRPEEMLSQLGFYSTKITVALLVVCTAVFCFLAYRSRVPRYVFKSSVVKWARWLLIVVTFVASAFASRTFWRTEAQIVQTNGDFAQKVQNLAPFREAVAKVGFLSRVEVSVPGCAIRPIAIVAPQLPDTASKGQRAFELVLVQGTTPTPAFDEEPKVQSDGQNIIATAKLHGLGEWRGNVCPAGAATAVIELRRKHTN